MDVLNTIHAIGSDGKADGPSLEPLIHYGWLGIVAKPLYIALRFLARSAWLRHQQLGLVHHHLHRGLQPAHAAHALRDDEVFMKMMRIQPKVDAIGRSMRI
jgi:YidC/Oxa1 family membrane protein insertase